MRPIRRGRLSWRSSSLQAAPVRSRPVRACPLHRPAGPCAGRPERNAGLSSGAPGTTEPHRRLPPLAGPRLPARHRAAKRRGRCHSGAPGRRTQPGPPPWRRRGSAAAAARVTSISAALRARPRAGTAPQPESLRAPGPAPRRAAAAGAKGPGRRCAASNPCASAERRGPAGTTPALWARAGHGFESRSRPARRPEVAGPGAAAELGGRGGR